MDATLRTYDVLDLVHVDHVASDCAIVAFTNENSNNILSTQQSVANAWRVDERMVGVSSCTAECSVWRSLLPKTNRSGCKYTRILSCAVFVLCLFLRNFFCCYFAFRFCWISKSCVLISIILIMRSLTCQHTFIRQPVAVRAANTSTQYFSLNSAYTNECSHSHWNFHSFDGLLFVLCMRIFTEKTALCTSSARTRRTPVLPGGNMLGCTGKWFEW